MSGLSSQIPTWDEIVRIMPITTAIILIVVFGVYITKLLMTEHINSLKSFIEYLKNKDNKK